MEIGDSEGLSRVLGDAFPGAEVIIERDGGRFSLKFHQRGLLRPLDQWELSDGTLRYLCLAAALLTPRPPTLMILNEPETSLHPELLPARARLMLRAAQTTQLWVTSHSDVLVSLLQTDPACNHLRLTKRLGETLLSDVSPADIPAWRWPNR